VQSKGKTEKQPVEPVDGSVHTLAYWKSELQVSEWHKNKTSAKQYEDRQNKNATTNTINDKNNI